MKRLTASIIACLLLIGCGDDENPISSTPDAKASLALRADDLEIKITDSTSTFLYGVSFTAINVGRAAAKLDSFVVEYVKSDSLVGQFYQHTGFWVQHFHNGEYPSIVDPKIPCRDSTTSNFYFASPDTIVSIEFKDPAFSDVPCSP
ncbi:MAG: hypothetical protein P1R58_03515 [bacterium]|nr:hypothetical protein [bacterium]